MNKRIEKRILIQTKREDLLIGIIYSTFEESGPIPLNWFPKSLSYEMVFKILTNSSGSFPVNFQKMDDTVIIFPLPEFNLTGLSHYNIDLTDALKEPVITSITLLFSEKIRNFFSQNIKNLKHLLQILIEELKTKKNNQQLMLSQFYSNLKAMINRCKSIEIISHGTINLKDPSKNCVVLSHFHSKIGPRPFDCYPKNVLNEKYQYQISKELDTKHDQEVFIRSYPEFIALHHYFELPSKTARGQVEMCLISFIFERIPPTETINNILFHLAILIDQLSNKPGISLGFYNREYNPKATQDTTEEMIDYLRQWVKATYQLLIESKSGVDFEKSIEILPIEKDTKITEDNPVYPEIITPLFQMPPKTHLYLKISLMGIFLIGILLTGYFTYHISLGCV